MNCTDAAPREPTKGNSDHLVELDALRGMAALIVLIHHAAQLMPWAGVLPDFPWLRFLADALLDRSPLQVFREGRQAVLFFFVLSGYVITLGLIRNGSPGLLAYAVGRTVRLLVPVAASVVLSIAVWAIVFDPVVIHLYRPHTLFMWWNPLEVRNVLQHFVLVGADPDIRLNIVLWSLVHEWRISIFLPLVLLARGSPLLPVAVGVMLFAGAVFVGTPQDRVVLDYSILRSLFASAYFALAVTLGASLALLAPLTWPSRPTDCRAVIVATLALFSVQSDLAVFLGSALLITLASVPGSFRTFLRRRSLAWIGRVSFSLYLVHAIVLAGLLHAAHSWLSLPAIAVIGALASLPVAQVFYLYVERPSQRLARHAAAAVGRSGGAQAHRHRAQPS
jgi:peptidoglycan/LPS O-acetylase OafA/YrhL